MAQAVLIADDGPTQRRLIHTFELHILLFQQLMLKQIGDILDS